MNSPRKKAAVKEFAPLITEGKTIEEVKEAILSSDKGYTPDEAEEILAALSEEPAPAKTKTPEPVIEGHGIDLSKYDYNNLRGEAFKSYMAEVEKLDRSKKYVFEAYKVEPIREVRYEGVENSPYDTIGVRLFNTTPMKTTKIPLRTALEFNGVLQEGKNWFSVLGGQWIDNGGQGLYKGTYYLLKK